MVESKSTDKLVVLTQAIKTIPAELISRVKTFELNWIEVGPSAVPTIIVEFYKE